MPVLPKVTQVTRFQWRNSADQPAAVREKLPYPWHTKRLSKVSQLGQSIPGICSNRYRQMKSRRVAMQGETTQGGLQPIQGWRCRKSHKAASEGKSSNGVDRLVVWVMVQWDSGGNKTNSDGRLNFDHEHTKPATRLDHGHKLNKVNLRRNCKSQKGSRTAEKNFVGFSWTLGI